MTSMKQPVSLSLPSQASSREQSDALQRGVPSNSAGSMLRVQSHNRQLSGLSSGLYSRDSYDSLNISLHGIGSSLHGVSETEPYTDPSQDEGQGHGHSQGRSLLRRVASGGLARLDSNNSLNRMVPRDRSDSNSSLQGPGTRRRTSSTSQSLDQQEYILVAEERSAQREATELAHASARAAAADAAAEKNDPAPLPASSLLVEVCSEVFLTGDMPNYKKFVLKNHSRHVGFYLLLWLDVLLRGVSQVFLCDNPVSGLFILAGLACTSWSLVGYALLGTLFSSLGALLIARAPVDKVTSGLCGYDGALVGCACLSFLASPSPGINVLVAVVLSVVSGVLHVSLANLMLVFQLPPFTFGFNVTTIAFLLSLETQNAAVSRISAGAPIVYPEGYTDFSAGFMWDASVRGVGQFMFADTTEGGVLIILGICVASRMGGLASWLGASIAAITAFHLLQVPAASLPAVRNGLYGYNSAGCCAALAGGVFFDPSPSGVAFGSVGAALAVLVLTMFKALLGSYSLPVLTFPFIVTTWLMLLTKSSLLVPYPAHGTIAKCEQRLWRYLVAPSRGHAAWTCCKSGQMLKAISLSDSSASLADEHYI